MPKIMEPKVRDAGILQRGPKGSADPLQWPALVGEDVAIGQTANLGQSLDGLTPAAYSQQLACKSATVVPGL